VGSDAAGSVVDEGVGSVVGSIVGDGARRSGSGLRYESGTSACWMTWPRAHTDRRSTKFSSSRTLPGHG